MKRASVGLVEYPSSEEETPNEQPKQKKRKLPTLSLSLTVPTPVDNPALHQGRVRTVPHVDGQYATYIHVPVILRHDDTLYTLVEDALTLATAQVPSLHTIGREEHGGVKDARWELHISLSRPLFLRAHQREELKRAVKQVASLTAPFDASFTTFTALTNDERTRSFLALELGAGHEELSCCLNLLGPTLCLLRQKEFYIDPKFHASIAWVLLERTPSSPNIVPPSIAEELDAIPPGCPAPKEQYAQSVSPRTTEQLSDNFHRILHLPPSLVPLLNETYAARLSQARTGGFVVDRISVKIGKDVFTWPLSGMK